MTVRNLDATFRPRSVALVGASARAGSVGDVVLRNVLAAGFEGRILPVNPKYDRLGELACYRSVGALPEVPNLAVIMTPPATVPAIVTDLAGMGCKGAVVITAGIAAPDRQQMLKATAPSLMRLVGPNTIGILSPRAKLNASFTLTSPRPGSLGLISQSGAIVSSIVDWADAQEVGFSQIISLGDMADVDVGDCINWLAADPHTSAILMYLETIPAPRKFMSAARAAARIKPVIAVKPGRHSEAAKAAMTHTGALAAADDVVDAALARAGVIRVDDLEDLFYAAEITARFRPLDSGRVAIVTNGGGAGVLAIDKLLDEHCRIAELAPETVATLDAGLPATWSRANPVDIIGDAPPERYIAAIRSVAADPGVDAVLAMNCPTALASPTAAAAGVSALADKGLVNGKPMIACWLGKRAAEPAREIFRHAGIATADTPTAAAEAIALLTRWSELRSRLDQVPASSGEVTVDREAAARVIAAAGDDNRTMLTEPEAKEVLAAYGIGVPPTIVARDADEIETAASELLGQHPAVVVKMLSRTISHKSDLGGVVLNLATAAQVRDAALAIQRRIEASGLSRDVLDGFTVQPMIRRAQSEELFMGLHRDRSFGPVMLFGAGGTAVEVIKDTATGLVPLDQPLAAELIDRTRIAARLAGYRDRPPANREAVTGALLGLSQLAIDFPCILSADINPLLADAEGVIALDARIEIEPARVRERGPGPELVIHPYPAGWNRTLNVNGTEYRTRPIRPADIALYPRFLERVSAEDMRLRFLVPTRSLSHETLVRLSQLDYDRDIAFVALDAATGELAAIIRYSSDPDHQTAEFGALVRSDLKGHGLGRALMQQLIDYAKADGLRRLVGTVLRDNVQMLDLATALGFRRLTDEDGFGTVLVELTL
jgi:acetyltransferase